MGAARLPLDWGPVFGDVGILAPGVTVEALGRAVEARRAFVEAYGGPVWVPRRYSLPDGSLWRVNVDTGELVRVRGRLWIVEAS